MFYWLVNLFRRDRVVDNHLWLWFRRPRSIHGPMWPHWRIAAVNCVRIFPPNKGTKNWVVHVTDDIDARPGRNDRFVLGGYDARDEAFSLAGTLLLPARRALKQNSVEDDIFSHDIRLHEKTSGGVKY